MHLPRTNDTPFSDGRPTPETNTSTIVCKNVRQMVFAYCATLHDFGENKFWKVIFFLNTIFIFSAKWQAPGRPAQGGSSNLQPIPTTSTYPKHTVKIGQPKPARAPNRMVCTVARSAWVVSTIGRAVFGHAHSRE